MSDEMSVTVSIRAAPGGKRRRFVNRDTVGSNKGEILGGVSFGSIESAVTAAKRRSEEIGSALRKKKQK